jgi:hypothetical protein
VCADNDDEQMGVWSENALDDSSAEFSQYKNATTSKYGFLNK